MRFAMGSALVCSTLLYSLGIGRIPQALTVRARELVPDKEAASAVAQAVASARYGKQEVAAEQPFRVERQGTVWLVRGTLEEGSLGGVLMVRIRAQSGCVEYMGHSK